jgi:serine/threonine protein kinase
MIDKHGNAKIMDFGIARSLSGRGITGAGVLIGTPEYMSPEQVEGKEVDQRSDLYSHNFEHSQSGGVYPGTICFEPPPTLPPTRYPPSARTDVSIRLLVRDTFWGIWAITA